MFQRFFILFAILVLVSCSKDAKIIHFSGKTMGVITYNVKYAEHPNVTKDFAISKVEDVLKAVNKSMSTWDKSSELSLINSSKVSKWYQLSPNLYDVIETAQSISKATSGAFDITVGPAVNLWGFGPDGERKVPERSSVLAALKKIGYKNISLDPVAKSLLKAIPNLYIDLSAIAKGYAVDRVGHALESMGISDYMVEIGGEVRTRGYKSGNTSWKIGIQSPIEKDGSSIKVINISGMSIATSGNYRNFFKSGGKLFSHTIDPTTGHPVDHKLISASVIHNNCMTADAMATALMVLGPTAGKSFVESNGIMAFLIYEEDGKVKTYTSEKFEQYEN
ncbi:MAG: FAD:protein FMN transferase [Bacteriovoracaceae bacterium]|nr:FAD:protein FMN transferase [Bacteriovoracaceae bacterium]